MRVTQHNPHLLRITAETLIRQPFTLDALTIG